VGGPGGRGGVGEFLDVDQGVDCLGGQVGDLLRRGIDHVGNKMHVTGVFIFLIWRAFHAFGSSVYVVVWALAAAV
jgi:hypothetical protein